MELFDAYNADGTKAGFELIKGQKLPDGIYRAVFYVTVRHTDGTYLLINSGGAPSDGDGMYECTLGGSVLKGENSYGAAQRKVREVTGVAVKDLELISYEVIKEKNEIAYGYLCELALDKYGEPFCTADGADYKWVSEAEIYAELSSKNGKIAYGARLLPYFAQRMKISRLKYSI